MSSPAKLAYVVVPITCPQCQQKQVVHVRARNGFAQMGGQTVRCVECERVFEVMVPDQIVGGPFFPWNGGAERT
jgi:transcription elongation factor Elf1